MGFWSGRRGSSQAMPSLAPCSFRSSISTYSSEQRTQSGARACSPPPANGLRRRPPPSYLCLPPTCPRLPDDGRARREGFHQGLWPNSRLAHCDQTRSTTCAGPRTFSKTGATLGRSRSLKWTSPSGDSFRGIWPDVSRDPPGSCTMLAWSSSWSTNRKTYIPMSFQGVSDSGHLPHPLAAVEDAPLVGDPPPRIFGKLPLQALRQANRTAP
jgi:hypothetical protein